MLKKHKWFLLAIAYTILVFVVSLVKIDKQDVITVSNFDKIVHVGIYFVFTIIWFASFTKIDFGTPFFKGVLKASGLALIVGVGIEFLQDMNPNARSGDVNDVLANSVGILIAVLCLYKIKKHHALNSVK